MSHYEYRKINLSLEPLQADELGPGGRSSEADVANRWGAAGWEPVLFIPAKGSGYADAMLIRRVLPEGERA